MEVGMKCNFEMRNDFVFEESDLAKFTVILYAIWLL